MSRAGGFLMADIDTNLLSDPKLRAVRRRLTPGVNGASENAVLCYIAVVLESWRNGERLTLMQSVPDWLTPQPGVAEALVAEGLLDAQQRIVKRVWDDWYGPAEARREQRRTAGAAGGRAAAERRYSGASSDAVPNRPANQPTNYLTNHQTTQPRARTRSRGATGQGPERLSDLLPPPPGHPDAE